MNIKIRTIIISFVLVLIITGFCSTVFAIKQDDLSSFISQSKREIPVISSVDIIVIGGSTSAVSAAISAAENGAKVFLVAPKPYLGEDLCATLRLKVDKNRILQSKIEKRIFQGQSRVTPLNVKAALSEALLEADVEFIFGSFVTDILWDKKDEPAGVVVANRGGRQAVKAKVIIDATDRAWICRMAGAEAYTWDKKEIEFERTVVMPGKDEENYITHSLKIPMADLDFPAFANAEQIARKNTYTDGQLRSSESLFHIPPDPIVCKRKSTEWRNIKNPDINHFKAKGFENLYVLSGSADIPRVVADSLLKPAALTGIAERMGIEAASMAKLKIMPMRASFKKTSSKVNSTGDISEILKGLRPINNTEETVESPEIDIPVIGDYDVVIVGGGTTGAPAAIAAGWWGMKVLVIEYLEGLGGIGTLGLIGKPFHGKKIGFAAEVPFPEESAEPKMEWYRSEIQKVGGEIWLGVLGCGVYSNNNVVKGAVITTPEGRGVVRAKVVIDATGSADMAIAAGANYMYGDLENDDIALQGTGFSSRPLTGNYYNSDYLLVDEYDMIDVWRSIVSVHITKDSENIYDAVPIIQNRERKRIVGDYILKYIDQVSERTFPDVIVISSSSYDSHGYPSSGYFALLPHDSISRNMNQPAPGGTSFTPYRCLLPKNLDGILVTGLGISMERDATAMVRMQLDLANQGYAAGVASMLAITNEVQPRNIDIKELQKILIQKGNLPDSVLHLKDSFPLSDEIIYRAVKLYGKAINPKSAGKPLAIILSHIDSSLPMIKEEFKKSTGKSKLLYAQLLGMCGEKDGVQTLLDELDSFSEWDEKIYQGSMADYAHLPTPMDGVILSLGYSGDKSVIPYLVDLVDKLNKDVTLSHFRSVVLALEKFVDTSAAKPLAKLLQKPGIQGHAMINMDDAFRELHNNGKPPVAPRNTSYEKRTRAFREILLARALYRCGDYNDIAKNILENYQNDMQGLFARHASEILN